VITKLKELIHIMRQHSTVTFTLHGLGESIFECSYFDKVVEEFDQLEADAELGRAIRYLASNHIAIPMQYTNDYITDETIEYIVKTAKKVVENC
jgi:hypothetical protein